MWPLIPIGLTALTTSTAAVMAKLDRVKRHPTSAYSSITLFPCLFPLAIL